MILEDVYVTELNDIVAYYYDTLHRTTKMHSVGVNAGTFINNNRTFLSTKIKDLNVELDLTVSASKNDVKGLILGQ